jgi:hypothetical protein
MFQHAARRRVTLCTGCQGSGKTTFLLRYLVADKSLACRFIFDPAGDMADRLGIVRAETEQELECSIEDGWAAFDPGLKFPGDPTEGLKWFAGWSYERAKQIKGNKALLVDEVWKYSSPNAIPLPLALWIQDGRKYGLHPLFATQRPNRINEAITNELTELVCFRLNGGNALEAVERLGAPAPEILKLPMGSFVSLNVDSGRLKRGKLF